MATGLLDAGGRNVTIGTRSRSGYFRRTSTVGLAIFLQYWCALLVPACCLSSCHLALAFRADVGLEPESDMSVHL